MRRKNTLKVVLTLASVQLLVVTGAFALTPRGGVGQEAVLRREFVSQ